jgi:hypothetical protein
VSTPESERFINAVAISLSKSQTFDDHAGAARAHEVGQQPAKMRDLDVRDVGDRLADHLLALVQREERFALLRVDDDGDQDVLEDLRSALDDVEVADGQRVERARVDRGLACAARDAVHAAASLGRRKASATSP